MISARDFPRLAALARRAREFLGCELPFLGGAMTLVSEANLVSAISNAGGFGVLACGAMDPERLAAEIRRTRARTDRPFGVNLIVMHPRLDELVEACIAEGVGHVVLAGGLPPRPAVEILKRHGVKVMAFAPSLVLARRMVRQGIDALVIEGSEAGGHIGPVSTSVLAQEILPHLREVPVFVAGGIGRGEMIAAYMAMGAAGVQMGTRFVCAEESIVHPRTKQAYIRASARDAQPSVQVDPDFPVVPVRALVNEATRDFVRFQLETIARHRAGELSAEEAKLAIEHYWAGALRRAVIEGDVERGSLMAGQSVGMVTKIEPVEAILATLAEETERALSARAGGLVEGVGAR